jgi:hypothetical protein
MVTNGAGSFVLTKPTGAKVAGSVDIAANLGGTGSPADCSSIGGGTALSLSYLSGKWCGNSYNRNPTARATFGIFGSHLRKGPIYIRENY